MRYAVEKGVRIIYKDYHAVLNIVRIIHKCFYNVKPSTNYTQ